MRVKWLFLGMLLVVLSYSVFLYVFLQQHAFALDTFLKTSALFLVVLFLFFIALIHRHMFPAESSDKEKLRAEDRRNGWVNFKDRV